MNPNRDNAKKKLYRLTTLAFVLLFVCLGVGVYFVGQFGEGAILVYARQQDAYVQLVLDQINLLKKGATAEDITAILSTMDSSTHKYWTLSEDDSLIFVKNIQETNRYKGFSTATFFASDAGLDFLNEMELNYVSHRIIELEQQRYVVSGTVFRFGGADYTLCLMTDVDVVLEENAFLSAKIVLYVVLVLTVIIAGVALLSMADYYRRRLIELDEKEAHIETLNQKIEKLNHRINKNDMFHPRWNLYRQEMIPSFLIGFEEKGVKEMTFAILEFSTAEKQQAFLEDALVFLDRSVLRFQLGSEENRLFLLFVNTDEEEAMRQLHRTYLLDREILGTTCWTGEGTSFAAGSGLYEQVTGEKL